jgi:hypothetical protein
MIIKTIMIWWGKIYNIYFLNNNDNKINKYIHDIRNGKKFTRDTLVDINNLPQEDKFKILLTYNEMIEYYVDLINNL